MVNDLNGEGFDIQKSKWSATYLFFEISILDLVELYQVFPDMIVFIIIKLV